MRCDSNYAEPKKKCANVHLNRNSTKCPKEVSLLFKLNACLQQGMLSRVKVFGICICHLDASLCSSVRRQKNINTNLLEARQTGQMKRQVLLPVVCFFVHGLRICWLFNCSSVRLSECCYLHSSTLGVCLLFGCAQLRCSVVCLPACFSGSVVVCGLLLQLHRRIALVGGVCPGATGAALFLFVAPIAVCL